MAGIDDIQLFCAQGKSGFYLRNGFAARPADAPGMQFLTGPHIEKTTALS